jgi:hypothetical protein
VAIASLGLLAAAVLGLSIAWDGGWQMARGLADGVPFTGHARLLNLVVDWPMILASTWIGDPRLLVAIHGLGHAALPIGALVASWRLLRPDRLDLLPLPLLGICLLALPGMAFLISEAMIVAVVGWPLVLAVARGRARQHPWLVAGLVVVVAASHPVGVGILVMAALATAVTRPSGRPDRVLLGSLLLVACAAAVRYVAFADPYEQDATTFETLWVQVRGTLLRAPGITVGASLTAAALVTAASRWPGTRRLALVAALGLTVIAGAALVPWAGDLVAWGPALRYRGLAALATAPALALAILALRRPAAGVAGESGRLEGGIGLAAAAGFTVVLTVQGLAWRTALDRVTRDAALAPGPCVAEAALDVPRGSALDHWGLTADVLVWTGPRPTRLVLPGELCPGVLADGRIIVKAIDDQPVDLVAPGRARWWSFDDLLPGRDGS